MIQVYCELLVERVKFIESSPNCPPELRPIVVTILYAVEESSIEGNTAIRRQFCAKYGRSFVRAALDNTDGLVDPRILSKLSFQMPSDKEVEVFWRTIQSEHQTRKQAIDLQRQQKAQKKAEAELTSTASSNDTADATDDDTPADEPSKVCPLNPQYRSEEDVISDRFADLSINKGHNDVVAQSALSPVLPFRIFRPNPDLEIAFDVRTKNPIYVLERIDPTALTESTPRVGSFYEESASRLATGYRSRLSHYQRSGYDRGHLAPAADFPALATVMDTFTLCNVSPQVPKMNQSIWKKLEVWCRKVAAKEPGETHVVTGPLWLPLKKSRECYEYKYPALGGSKPEDGVVAVPTHFFKAVVVLRNGSLERRGCFIVPNAEPKDTTLDDFRVNWKKLEAVSGLQLFPTNPTPLEM